jgi:hypothetical protein
MKEKENSKLPLLDNLHDYIRGDVRESLKSPSLDDLIQKEQKNKGHSSRHKVEGLDLSTALQSPYDELNRSDFYDD